MRRRTWKRLIFGVLLCLGCLLIGFELHALSPWIRNGGVAMAERVGADNYLMARLADHDSGVRTAAGPALVRRGPRAVPALVARLDDPDPENRRSAANVLAKMGPAAADALPALRRVAIEDREEEVLEIAGRAWGLVARGRPEAVDEILAMLAAPEDARRLGAIRAAAVLEDSRAVPLLVGSLEHENAKVREEAAEALGDLGNLGSGADSALPALIDTLTDRAPAVRSEAREAIAKLIKRGPDGRDGDLYRRAEQALAKAQAEMHGPAAAPADKD